MRWHKTWHGTGYSPVGVHGWNEVNIHSYDNVYTLLCQGGLYNAIVIWYRTNIKKIFYSYKCFHSVCTTSVGNGVHWKTTIWCHVGVKGMQNTAKSLLEECKHNPYGDWFSSIMARQQLSKFKEGVVQRMNLYDNDEKKKKETMMMNDEKHDVFLLYHHRELNRVYWKH